MLRNTKSDKLYILGVRWIAHLALVRRVNRRARAIARLLLTGLISHTFTSTKDYSQNVSLKILNSLRCKTYPFVKLFL